GGRPTVFGDGTQTRDYIYVGDVVSAALAAAASDVTGAINVGTGRETTVLELVDSLRELSGNEGFEPEFAPPRTGEVQRIAIDAGRAERELGWRAEMGLDEGLRLTLDSL
ncbi:MAG TPA: GDP-mannose 4,6-dehydratase, partial [Solirubrobacterales bacterium]